MSAAPQTFYKRPLPPSLVPFSSPEGRAIFSRAMSAAPSPGTSAMDAFFLLIAHLVTQADPAFCGLGTLATVLNALEVDPGRPWKGVWRYYDETLLDCCRPLETVRKQGITLDEFACLARCNGLRADVFRADASTEEEFRRAIELTSSYASKGSGAPAVLCVAYHRGTLGQTGDGHFSPVGGWSPADDRVLVLDVARFKYPTYWADVRTLWESLGRVDSVSGRPRGFVVLSRAGDPPPFGGAVPANDRGADATPVTSLGLTTLTFRHFYEAANRAPDAPVDSAEELARWVLARVKEVTSGMADGGGSYSIVDRVGRAAIAAGDPVAVGQMGEAGGASVADGQWDAVERAVSNHPMFHIAASLSPQPASPHLAAFTLLLLLPRLPALRSSPSTAALLARMLPHLDRALEGDGEAAKAELENLGRQWDALRGQCCAGDG
ncbi:Phytochelatin synthase-domain-containing protein [Hyaloraphidium curvatum]|nr:Phytochelatin synthase-domain-containing protein [Hyaloraphidium curvatum]